jgi:peptidoglycan/xylan/chitin deacetylase (PgdA/CDA1 family)
MKLSLLLTLLLRGLLVSLGLGWLVLCVVVPMRLLASTPPDSIIPLPVAPIVLPSPTPVPTPRIVSYHAHTLAPGEDLEGVALIGGSAAQRIIEYNRLTGAPQAGRALIVPQLEGQPASLPHAPVLVVQGRTEQPRVALTLDAGAGSAPVPRILEVLRERDTQLTFFLTGTWAAENPDLARQIVADGHELANHSLTHSDFTTLSDAAIMQELSETERILQRITGASTRPFFRPPYGAYNSRVLLATIEQGYLPIYWTFDSLDSVGAPKSAEFLVQRVTGTYTPAELRGAIILAHCGSEATAEALPTILDRFDAMGLQVGTLSEVLGP